MKVMLLRSQETMSGRKEYIVMGTTSVCSEETASTGKVVTLSLYLSLESDQCLTIIMYIHVHVFCD